MDSISALVELTCGCLFGLAPCWKYLTFFTEEQKEEKRGEGRGDGVGAKMQRGHMY